ncbi:MAG: sodium/solute symporter [Planctomycetes bacterium]|nr:sodium/solute symporter [Planctomycetota bacterium]
MPRGTHCFVMFLWTVFLASMLPVGELGAQTRWEALPSVPDEQGFAGAFVGVSGDALLLAGGANFPKPQWESEKAWFDRVFVLADPEGEWREVGRLPRVLGYGMSVSVGDELVCMGGDDGQQIRDEVFALRWNGSELVQRDLPALPLPRAYGGAAAIGSVVYVVAGQAERSIASARASGWRIDLGAEQPAWEPLPELPGGVRAHPFVLAQHDGRSTKLYVFGGRRHDEAGPFELAFLDDVWCYDPRTKTWEERAHAPRPLMAGSGVAYGQAHLIVTSYADGSLLRAMASSGTAERTFDHPGFPRTLYAYHTITDAWSTLGEIPEEASNQVTTRAVQWRDRIVVPSGEVKPRVRTPHVWAVTLEPRQRSFGILNLSVLIVYLLAMVGVGAWFAKRNRDTNDYFRGGQHVPWWAAACSIYATMLSSLTYVALPALVFATDWVLYPGLFLILGVAPIAIYVAMPFYRRMDVTSAYEFFGQRFGNGVRLLASGSFTLFHIARMGIVMAVTALSLAAVTQLDAFVCVLLMGVLCLVYCTLGGIRAVIWTDTIQTFVLLGGALCCIAFLLTRIDGGFATFVDLGVAHDKFRLVNLDFGPNSFATLSFWVIVLGAVGQNLSSYTADQAVVQRYVTTRDTRAAARSIWMNGLMVIPGSLLFFLLGTGLYAFYRTHPQELDPTIQTDQILPMFIGSELPIGLAGLLVAGIFAAAQSTVSTSMNSTATTIVTDFLRPWNVCRTERGYLKTARWLTFLMGVLGTATGLLFISPAIRSLMAEYYKVIGMFMGALGGLFLLAVTSRRANGLGALIGLLAGVSAMVWVWRGTRTDGYLYATIGIVVCWVVGYAASRVLPTRRRSFSNGA